MTCEEIQSYLKGSEIEGSIHPSPAETTQHVSECDSCRRFMETRKEILATLRLLRETAPTFTASLDAAVLASYREQMASLQLISSRPRYTRMGAIWRLGITAAAALVVLAAVFGMRRSPSAIKPRLQTLRPTNIARASDPKLSKATRPGPHRTKNTDVAKASSPTSNPPRSQHLSVVAPTFGLGDSQGFRSLMYCDELSCDGGMELERVQLPALPSGFLPASNTQTQSVSADVLVGPDGIARGIRIVH